MMRRTVRRKKNKYESIFRSDLNILEV